MFWSETVAEGSGEGLLKALCMDIDSDHFHEMVYEGCTLKTEGDPIDIGRADPDPFL
jgi:hypothetical protein